MTRLEEAQDILTQLGMPAKQCAQVCCYTLLGLAGIGSSTSWSQASNVWLRIHDLITSTKESFGVSYAENSRETFRKQALHHFRQAAIIEDNAKVTNSPHYRYRLTEEALRLIRHYKKGTWKKQLASFLASHESLIAQYASKKKMQRVDVAINAQAYTLSAGKHNILQKKILEDFLPRFAPGALCLYVGDTDAKELILLEDELKERGIDFSVHDKMPDVILYSEEKDWLYFIEAVTSVGPMDAKRLIEISKLSAQSSSGKIYVTAFLDLKTFKKFSDKLAWETEVWIADLPEHMIHLNGDRFMGPRNTDHEV